jgi:hypothetical protein
MLLSRMVVVKGQEHEEVKKGQRKGAYGICSSSPAVFLPHSIQLSSSLLFLFQVETRTWDGAAGLGTASNLKNA